MATDSDLTWQAGSWADEKENVKYIHFISPKVYYLYFYAYNYNLYTTSIIRDELRFEIEIRDNLFTGSIVMAKTDASKFLS